MLERPLAGEYGSHFEPYVEKVPDVDLAVLLESQIEECIQLLSGISEEQSKFRYAEGKWSLKEVLGHIADTERIMSYRLLRIARGDKTPLPGFEENLFVAHSQADTRSMNDLLQDFAAVRIATLSLFRQLDDEAWMRVGNASGHDTTARAIAYIIAGHAIHHMGIMKDRYLSAIQDQ